MPEGHPVRSFLAVPVKARGAVIGGLFFGHPEPGRFSESDERIAVGIAAHAGVALENARLYDAQREARAQAEKARERLSLVAEASRLLTESLELDTVLHGLAALLVPRVADACRIDVVDDDGTIRLAAAAVAPELTDDALRLGLVGADHAAESHPVAQAVRTRSAQLIERIDDAMLQRLYGGDPAFLESIKAFAPLSAAIVPLVQPTRVMGVIMLATTATSGRRLTDDDLLLTQEIAHRAAAAAENARLYMDQRAAAETLQHSLLPEVVPEIPGVEMAARYLPGGPGVDIGGDWYDILLLPDGTVGLAMGDVVGRGIGAASLMGQLRNALRAYALEGQPPGEILARLNRMLDSGSRGEQMATLVYGTLDLRTGEFLLANAGHPPPAVVTRGGTVKFLDDGGGMPLGAVARTQFEERTVKLAPGEGLVLFTDGLVESRDTPLGEGLERLRSALAEIDPSDGAEEWCDRALARCERLDVVPDDVALLVLRFLSLEAGLHASLPTQPGILKPLRSALRRWLEGVGLSEEETLNVLVATGEAAANAIRHTTADRFEIVAEQNGAIRVEIRDRGRWRESTGSGSGGRGLMIMQELMDDVQVVKGPPETIVTLHLGAGNGR